MESLQKSKVWKEEKEEKEENSFTSLEYEEWNVKIEVKINV